MISAAFAAAIFAVSFWALTRTIREVLHLAPRASVNPQPTDAPAPTVDTPLSSTRRSPQQIPAVVAADAGERAA